MANLIMGHGVSWCFGTELAPRGGVLDDSAEPALSSFGGTIFDAELSDVILHEDSLIVGEQR